MVVTALSGQEGDRTTYVAKVTFSQLAEHFNTVEHENLPEGVILQRELAVSRSRNIKKYIQHNADFIFPELIAIVESLEVAETDLTGVNIVTLLAEHFRYLVDGQGRLVAIKSLLIEDMLYSNQSVDVKFVISRSLTADAQIFTDVNRTPTAVNSTQAISMDSREVLSRFTREVVASSCIKPWVCSSKSSVTTSSKTEKVWTLNQISKFILLVSGTTTKSAQKLLEDEDTRQHWIDFINTFFGHLQTNQDIKNVFTEGRCASKDTIIGTATFLKGLAIYGRVIVMNFIANESADWSFTDALSEIDFSIHNPEWVGRCLNWRGKLEDKGFNHRAIASYLCEKSSLQVPEELATAEEDVLLSRANIMKQQRENRTEAKQ